MWHNVKDWLPSVKETTTKNLYISKEVLVTDGESIGVGVYIIDETSVGEKFCFFDTSIVAREHPTVTHWMLKPLLPDGGESK